MTFRLPSFLTQLGGHAGGLQLQPRREQVIALLAAEDWAELTGVARAHTKRGEVTHGLRFLTAGQVIVRASSSTSVAVMFPAISLPVFLSNCPGRLSAVRVWPVKRQENSEGDGHYAIPAHNEKKVSLGSQPVTFDVRRPLARALRGHWSARCHFQG